MYRCKVLLVFLFSVLTASAAVANMDSLYLCLDEAIDNSQKYIDVREKRIDSLRNLLGTANDDGERYRLSFKLYREYQSFMSDSALVYINRCIAMAERAGDQEETCRCRSLMAFQCSTTGMYVEALDILIHTDTTGVGNASLGEYYLAYSHVFGELGYYGKIDDMRGKYYVEQAKYIDKALTVLDENSEEYLLRREQRCYADNDIDKALQINARRMKLTKKGSHEYAIVAFYRYMDYKLAGKMDEAKYWLTEAALSDVRNAVTDQAALWELANLLNKEGQLMRSYRYISFAWESAVKFNTRMRSWQISPILQAIDRSYQQDIESSNTTLRVLVIIISVMAVLLLGLIFYMGRQRNRLTQTHKELSEKSTQLSGLNDSLRTANANLDEANRQLKNTVGQLHEQTRVNEEYVGRFMRLCSLYIDKNDDFRKRVNKMLKNREYEELYRLTKSSDMKDHELEEFYNSFDSAFLHLFPNFVDDFNALLRPEERITVSGEYKLNTGLRIFALIRLGIEDSSTIAEFLHYSVNTIYNYRARIKNGAADSRGAFESLVKKIGMPE